MSPVLTRPACGQEACERRPLARPGMDASLDVSRQERAQGESRMRSSSPCMPGEARVSPSRYEGSGQLALLAEPLR